LGSLACVVWPEPSTRTVSSLPAWAEDGAAAASTSNAVRKRIRLRIPRFGDIYGEFASALHRRNLRSLGLSDAPIELLTFNPDLKMIWIPK